MNHSKQLIQKKLFNWESIKHYRNKWRRNNDKIVFTNGCFDIIHPGHLSYLMEAADLGDILVIGLNSDFSVRRLKGVNRPINHQDDRAFLLASLFFVDAVIVFEEDDPLSLIKLLQPHILVKGGNYDACSIIGAKETIAAGGRVKSLDFIEGYSTTSIVNKIRKNNLE